MAEIKSTLDLIMERTKHLTMTDEEKKALHSQQLKGKVKGWVQKYVDGTLDIGHLQENVEQESVKEPELTSDLFQELIERIDPDAENGKILQLIENILHFDTVPLRESIDRFRRELEEKADEKTARAKRSLKQRKISGNAVVPNLKGDAEWVTDREQLKGIYLERIRSIGASGAR